MDWIDPVDTIISKFYNIFLAKHHHIIILTTSYWNNCHHQSCEEICASLVDLLLPFEREERRFGKERGDPITPFRAQTLQNGEIMKRSKNVRILSGQGKNLSRVRIRYHQRPENVTCVTLHLHLPSIWLVTVSDRAWRAIMFKGRLNCG